VSRDRLSRTRSRDTHACARSNVARARVVVRHINLPQLVGADGVMRIRQSAVFDLPGPVVAKSPFTLLVLTSTPSALTINRGRNVRGAVIYSQPVGRERALPLLSRAGDEAGATAGPRVAEDEFDAAARRGTAGPDPHREHRRHGR
jgi:hypothetical protein